MATKLNGRWLEGDGTEALREPIAPRWVPLKSKVNPAAGTAGSRGLPWWRHESHVRTHDAGYSKPRPTARIAPEEPFSFIRAVARFPGDGSLCRRLSVSSPGCGFALLRTRPSMMPRKVVRIEDRMDRWRFTCPRGHRSWEPTNHHFWCQQCARLDGVTRPCLHSERPHDRDVPGECSRRSREWVPPSRQYVSSPDPSKNFTFDGKSIPTNPPPVSSAPKNVVTGPWRSPVYSSQSR